MRRRGASLGVMRSCPHDRSTFQSVERQFLTGFPRTPKGKLNWQGTRPPGRKKNDKVYVGRTSPITRQSVSSFHEKKNTERARIYLRESAEVLTHPYVQLLLAQFAAGRTVTVVEAHNLIFIPRCRARLTYKVRTCQVSRVRTDVHTIKHQTTRRKRRRENRPV